MSIDVNIEGVGQIEVAVEYPWKPEVCTICKGFGHNDQHCMQGKRVWRVKTSTSASSHYVHSDPSKSFEP